MATPHPDFPTLHVLDHPLIQHKLSIMRDKTTSTTQFRQLLREIALLMGYEITRNLPMTTREIETPICRMQAPTIAGKKIAVVPILRAGLGMQAGVLDLIPSAKVSVVGLARNHETLQPENYFERFVGQLDERTAIIIDPMLATAGSMIATVVLLKARGCTDIRALVLVAAPEGIAALERAHPDVRCWTAAIDSHLDEAGYIIPGLGDAGDKIFGTK